MRKKADNVKLAQDKPLYSDQKSTYEISKSPDLEFERPHLEVHTDEETFNESLPKSQTQDFRKISTLQRDKLEAKAVTEFFERKFKNVKPFESKKRNSVCSTSTKD